MAETATRRFGALDGWTTVTGGLSIDGRFLAFYAAVVLVQGVHVIEHIIQLIQVYVLGIPDDEALGLLGYVFSFQGTEEWLHIAFNVSYLASLVVIAWGLLRSPLAKSVVPLLAMLAFSSSGSGSRGGTSSSTS